MKFYVKDLDIFKKNYDLKNIIIIDNSVLSFAFHLNNGIPVIPYYDSKEDKELKLVALYLLSIADCDNVCSENIKHFQLEKCLEIAKNNINNSDGSLSEISDEESESEKKDNIPITNVEKPDGNTPFSPKPKIEKEKVNSITASGIISKHQLITTKNVKKKNFLNRNSCIFQANKNYLGLNNIIFYPNRGNIRSNKKPGTIDNKMNYANIFKNICFKYANKKNN